MAAASFSTSPTARSLNGAPFLYPRWNVRLGLQFTEYPHFYGGMNNFDGSFLGRAHNASGNN
jgi:hypothetical protein